MKARRLLVVLTIFCSLGLLAQDKIVFKESEGVDLLQMLERNQIFVERIQSADIDEQDNLYLLDDALGNVFRIDLKRGTLVNKISSKGQGPAELMMPSVIRVLNKKVFVLSEGHSGIQIFSNNGDFLGGFRTKRLPRWMDIDKEENVYVAETDSDENPIISVYTSQGRQVRTAALFRLEPGTIKDKAQLFMKSMLKFRLDSSNNIIVLAYLSRELKKIDPAGNLIWEKKINNSILKPFLANEGVNYDQQTIRTTVFGLDVDQEGNIIIGHVGGGCVYNAKGELIRLLEVYSKEKRRIPPPLYVVKVWGRKILVSYQDGTTYIFEYRLGNN